MDPSSLVSKDSLPDLWAAIPHPASDGGGLLWTRPDSSGGARIALNSLFAEGSSVTDQSIRLRAGRKQRVAVSDEDSSKLLSTCSGDDLTESEAKRQKVNGQRDEQGDPKAETEVNSGTNSKKGNQASVGPKQDYIHVRARRGQATDSHSLAERARREKISERMRILQDLVPGCNKVIGKALVLDEIINYIQSLQHQVEFLSMKLEAVSAPMNHCVEGFPEEPFETASRFSFNPSPPPQPPPPPPPREYVQVSAEWLDMHVGGGFKRSPGS